VRRVEGGLGLRPAVRPDLTAEADRRWTQASREIEPRITATVDGAIRSAGGIRVRSGPALSPPKVLTGLSRGLRRIEITSDAHDDLPMANNGFTDVRP
jgi:hypothetical protein